MRGFTLVELMVTVAVLGILSAIAAPSFASLLKDDRVSAHSHSLKSAVALLRSEAIKQNRQAVLCASIDGLSCVATAQSGASQWQSYQLLGFVKSSPNAVITSAAAVGSHTVLVNNINAAVNYRYDGGLNITFNSDGSVSNPSSFVICSADNDLSFGVKLTLLGSGRIISSDLSAQDSCEVAA